MNDSELIEITGLWKNKSKNGNTYLVGYMGKARVFIFPNQYAKSDKHPTHRMFIAPEIAKDEKEDGIDLDEDDVEF